jgi:protein-disulfide isomerase
MRGTANCGRAAHLPIRQLKEDMPPQTPTPTKRERRDAARAERLERERVAAASATRKRRLLQLGGLLAAAVVVVVAAIAISSGGGKSTTPTASKTATTLFDGIPQQGITLGNPKAPVTVVEFADPQCPFCRDYTLGQMPDLVQKYVRTGKVKMQLRMMSFIGPDSVTAARAIEAAGLQDKLWNAADAVYANQGQENSGYVTTDYLKSTLGPIKGLDVGKALSDSSSAAVNAQLGATQTLASRYAVSSTPTFLVGKGANLQKVPVDQLGAHLAKVS